MLLTLTVIISIDIEWFSSRVVVGANHLVYELIAEISSDDSAEDGDDNFEQYLLQSCSSQVMAKTKQTMWKTDDKGQLILTGGKKLATKGPVRKSPRKAGHDTNHTGFTSDEPSEAEPVPQPQLPKQPTRSPEALCRAVIFYVLYFIYIFFSCYIFTKVQLLWLLHSCGSSP